MVRSAGGPPGPGRQDGASWRRQTLRYAWRMTIQIAVRLPEDLVRQLDAVVAGAHDSRSDAVRRAIELYVYRLACERDAQRYAELPLTDAELALADDSDAWSGTPAW